MEGDLPEDELKNNCHDQTVENASNHFLDDEYYALRDYDFKDIKVPMLSVANWGGITLHLRGNIEGKGFYFFTFSRLSTYDNDFKVFLMLGLNPNISGL